MDKIKVVIKKKSPKILKYGDVCSGIGCVAQALKGLNIPFDYCFASDINAGAKKNLLANFNVLEFHKDILHVTELPKVDLFTAGFPCQPFSKANRMNAGSEHPKHDLFTDVIRCLRLCDPETFILENVASLTFKNHAKYFQYICQTLDGLGYNWDYKVMNSKDYGTPQSRNRVYFVGRKLRTPRFPQPEPLLETISDILDLSLPMLPFATKSVHTNSLFTGIKEGIWYIDNGQSTGNFCHFHQLPEHQHSYCLTATVGNHVYTRKDGVIIRRRYTIDECRRLQNIHPSFNNICPDTMFPKQIGNGMDVSMMSKLISLNWSPG